MNRREFLLTSAISTGVFAAGVSIEAKPLQKKPNILFIMTDQQRFDTIASLGNKGISTPNLDRLVRRGVSFTNCYSSCPECVPVRYVIRTGRQPAKTGVFGNAHYSKNFENGSVEDRCGKYLARTMGGLGYRTFGIGKFHSNPWDEDLGYEVHLHSEELYYTASDRSRDSYASWVSREHSEFDYVEGYLGERTEMYYKPQARPLPAEASVESWLADRAVEQIGGGDVRPYFGFLSFITPHPPLAPPVPYNRIYDPDKMSNPIYGDIENDHADEHIPWMNYLVWAEDINDSLARVLKARYYGQITFIDKCIGQILDAVEARGDGDNTLICFYSDHGDLLGDHRGWQKESFFEASCNVPMLLSWPGKIKENSSNDELVCLMDLFGLATKAGGAMETRDGIDVLGMLEGQVRPRKLLFGCYGVPGSLFFKVMVRDKKWKYIYFANGGREQLFDMVNDSDEMKNRAKEERKVAARFREQAIKYCKENQMTEALKDGDLIELEYEKLKRHRVYQFDLSRGIKNFSRI